MSAGSFLNPAPAAQRFREERDAAWRIATPGGGASSRRPIPASQNGLMSGSWGLTGRSACRARAAKDALSPESHERRRLSRWCTSGLEFGQDAPSPVRDQCACRRVALDEAVTFNRQPKRARQRADVVHLGDARLWASRSGTLGATCRDVDGGRRTARSGAGCGYCCFGRRDIHAHTATMLTTTTAKMLTASMGNSARVIANLLVEDSAEPQRKGAADKPGTTRLRGRRRLPRIARRCFPSK